MAIFLDSADRDEIEEAMTWGVLAGITTNPALLASVGDVGVDVLKPLCQLVPGRIFYQVTTHSCEAMLLEAQAAFSVSPSQIVIKVPCTIEGFRAAARLSLETPCAMTAIYSASQALLAREAGARYIVPYYDRANRQMGGGVALVQSLARVLGQVRDDSPEIVAASIKSPAQAVAAVTAGARHLALPFSVIREMAHHPLTVQAVKDFDAFIR